MAASVSASVSIGDSSGASTTLETASFTPTGSNKTIYALVGGGDNSPGDPTAVKYASTAGAGGESLTLLDSIRTINTNIKSSVWKLVAPSAPSGTIHATFGAATSERWIIAVAVQDSDGTEGTIAYATDVPANTATVNVVSSAGELVLDFLSVLDNSGSSGSITCDGSQTSLRELEGGGSGGATSIGQYELAGASSEVAAGASTTMSWTIVAASAYGIHAFQVNPYSAPAGGSFILKRRNIALLTHF